MTANPVESAVGAIARTPAPPYYAVIFTSERNQQDGDGYSDLATRMAELASTQPGYLGIESARDNALGITVSYWSSVEAIAAWRANAEHLEAQRLGRTGLYSAFMVRVCRVEREYVFNLPDPSSP